MLAFSTRIGSSVDYTRRAAVFLDRHAWLQVAAWSVPYLIFSAIHASHRPLWFDEVITVHLARLQTWPQLLAALHAGVDLQPPVFYWITRLFTSVAGQSEFAYRLPAIAGFWLMSVCLFRFVAYRAPALAGTLASLCLLTSNIFPYATEARPYGLVLGFSGLALLCWQRAGARRSRNLYLAGLAAGIALALSCHYYAVMMVAALFAAEAVRSLLRRRIDIPVAAAMAAGSSVFLLYLPLIRDGVRIYGKRPWNPPSLTQVAMTYELGYLGQAVPVGLTLALVCLLAPLWPRLRRRHPAIPASDIAACACLLLIPVGAFVIARLGANMLVPRYSIAVGLPVAIAFAWACVQMTGGNRGLLLTATLFIGLWFATFGFRDARGATYSQRPNVSLLTEQPAYRDLPILFPDPVTYMPFWHYSSPELRKRWTVILDPPLATRNISLDAVDRNILAAEPYFPVHGQSWQEFSSAHRRFLFYWTGAHFPWVHLQMRAERARFELLEDKGGVQLYLISLP